MKRFYKTATAGAADDHWTVLLDGRGVKTPARRDLRVPSAPLAEAMAEEWAAQAEEIRRHTMPLTQLACTCLDRVAAQRPEVQQQVVQYGATDLLSYWSGDTPALRARQTEHWQPVLDWAAESLGIRLLTTDGVMPVHQSPDTLATLETLVDALDDWAFTALQLITQASGSLLLALALQRGRLDAAAVIRAAHLDETWQEENWGQDREALAMRRARETDIEAAARFLILLPGNAAS